MNIITENIDMHPYTGVRTPTGKVRVLTHEEAYWLDRYFDGTPNTEQIKGITRGKEYEVVKVEGFGDCEDITIIDDNGNLKSLADFFFAKEDKISTL